MNRAARIFMHDQFAGLLKQDADGYTFSYDSEYLNSENPFPISLTLPLKKESYQSNTFFPFFDGLIPEGWYLDVDHSELNPRDRMGLLMALCKDCMGAVSIQPVEEAFHE